MFIDDFKLFLVDPEVLEIRFVVSDELCFLFLHREWSSINTIIPRARSIVRAPCSLFDSSGSWRGWELRMYLWLWIRFESMLSLEGWINFYLSVYNYKCKRIIQSTICFQSVCWIRDGSGEWNFLWFYIKKNEITLILISYYIFTIEWLLSDPWWKERWFGYVLYMERAMLVVSVFYYAIQLARW